MVAVVPIWATNLGPVVLKPALDREDVVAHTCYPSPEETKAKRTAENSRPLCDLHSEFQDGRGCTARGQPPGVLSLLLTVLLQGCAELHGSKDTIVKSWDFLGGVARAFNSIV